MGAAALIVGAYALNLIMDLRIATALLLGAGAALAAWTVRRDGWWLPRPTKPQTVTLVAGGLLLAAAFLPHLHGRSGAMMGLNIDEDLYVPLAEALKWNTVFMPGLAEGPFQAEFQGLPNHSRGWGFPYLLTIGSVLSNAPAFHAYVPLLYLLVAGSRAGRLHLCSSRLADVRTSVGTGGNALTRCTGCRSGSQAWDSDRTLSHSRFFPVAAATGITALRRGGTSALILAALVSAALLVSYFWAISAVYLAVAVTLVVVLVVTGRQRLTTLRRALLLGVGTAILGAPGMVWLFVWALPRLANIAGDLNGQFGNAWGDTRFANVELAFRAGSLPPHPARRPAGVAAGRGRDRRTRHPFWASCSGRRWRWPLLGAVTVRRRSACDAGAGCGLRRVHVLGRGRRGLPLRPPQEPVLRDLLGRGSFWRQGSRTSTTESSSSGARLPHVASRPGWPPLSLA